MYVYFVCFVIFQRYSLLLSVVNTIVCLNGESMEGTMSLFLVPRFGVAHTELKGYLFGVCIENLCRWIW